MNLPRGPKVFRRAFVATPAVLRERLANAPQPIGYGSEDRGTTSSSSRYAKKRLADALLGGRLCVRRSARARAVPLRPSNASIALMLQLLMLLLMLMMLSEVALIAASALRFSRSPVQGGAAAAADAAADDDDAEDAFGGGAHCSLRFAI